MSHYDSRGGDHICQAQSKEEASRVFAEGVFYAYSELGEETAENIRSGCCMPEIWDDPFTVLVDDDHEFPHEQELLSGYYPQKHPGYFTYKNENGPVLLLVRDRDPRPWEDRPKPYAPDVEVPEGFEEVKLGEDACGLVWYDSKQVLEKIGAH
jgi:hypothetical protein